MNTRIFNLLALVLLMSTNSIFALDSLKCIAQFGDDESRSYLDAKYSTGDINGDGYTDVVSTSSNKVYIYFGSDSFDTTADFIIYQDSLDTGSNLNTFAGVVGCNGDINNDGFDDIVVAGHGQFDFPFAYVYLGGTEMKSKPDFILDSRSYQTNLLIENIDLSGDFNGDGSNDIIIGGTYSVYSWDGCKIVGFLGGSTLRDKPDFKLNGNYSDFIFKFSVGDFDGDCYDDIIVDMRDGYNDIVPGSYLFKGHDVDITLPYYYLEDSELINSFDFDSYTGERIACNGDFNGDGFDDLVHILEIDSTYTNGIFLGNPGNDYTCDIIFDDSKLLRSTEYTEINNDEYSDIIGKQHWTGDTLFIVEGNSYLDTTPDYYIANIGSNWSSKNLGNINGKGGNEILVVSDKARIYTNDYNLLSIEENLLDNKEFMLSQNYPNPFNPETTIKYILNKNVNNATLQIFNAQGQTVKRFNELNRNTGTHSLIFNGGNLNSGVYFYSLIVDGIKTETKKMMLVK